MRQQRNQEALTFAQQALALAPDDQKPVIQQLVLNSAASIRWATWSS